MEINYGVWYTIYRETNKAKQSKAGEAAVHSLKPLNDFIFGKTFGGGAAAIAAERYFGKDKTQEADQN